MPRPLSSDKGQGFFHPSLTIHHSMLEKNIQHLVVLAFFGELGQLGEHVHTVEATTSGDVFGVISNTEDLDGTVETSAHLTLLCVEGCSHSCRTGSVSSTDQFCQKNGGEDQSPLPMQSTSFLLCPLCPMIGKLVGNKDNEVLSPPWNHARLHKYGSKETPQAYLIQLGGGISM